MDTHGSEAGEGRKQETVEVEETVGIVVAVTDEEGQGEGNSERRVFDETHSCPMVDSMQPAAKGDDPADETIDPTPVNWDEVENVVGPPYNDYKMIVMHERTRAQLARKMIDLTPVNWEPVENVPSSSYIDYKATVMLERTPDLFPPPKGRQNFIGGIRVHTAGGKSLDLPRYAFLDTANPANLIIKVSQSTEDELRVRSYYSWSLINFVYQQKYSDIRELKHVFQLFTPANLGTHGAKIADDESVIFTAEHAGSVEDSFTYFQMRDGQYQGHITNTEETIGLYVDMCTDDGWRVKATSDYSLWDKFAIEPFFTPDLAPKQCVCCYAKKFGPKGFGYGQGAGALHLTS